MTRIRIRKPRPRERWYEREERHRTEALPRSARQRLLDALDRALAEVDEALDQA